MKKIRIILLMIILAPALVLFAGKANAAEEKQSERGVLASMWRLEKRGLANAFLFPAEWGHLPKAEYGGAFAYPLVLITHLGGRLFSGMTDIVFLPVAYPFTRYDDSIPVGLGWGEYPWDKPSNY